MSHTKIRKARTLERPEVGRWHISIFLGYSWYRIHGWYLRLGIFKLLNLPPEGEMWSKKDYKGFLIDKEIGLFDPDIHVDRNLPTREEIKQRIVIWKSRTSRFLASMWASMRGLR